MGTTKLYYLQDARSYCGDIMIWWRIGGKGYTTDLDQAQVFTEDELKSKRETDIPWEHSLISGKAKRMVNSEDLRPERGCLRPA